MTKSTSAERLQKLMARAGLGSRRACEEMIRDGRVTLNGQLATLGDRADLAQDQVRVDGAPLGLPQATTWVAFNKPMHVLSTDKGFAGDRRRTARSFIPLETRLFSVGRLDAESDGLMLFTNDGDAANRLSHPRYGHEKEYRALVVGKPDANTLRRWRRGVELEEGKTAPAMVSVLRAEGGNTRLKIIMHEGKKRQIRRVAIALGHPVRRLTRVRIATVKLGDLKPGGWRRLTPEEQRSLLTAKPERRGRSKRKGKRPRRGKR